MVRNISKNLPRSIGVFKDLQPLSLFGFTSLILSLLIFKYLAIAANDVVAYITAGIVVFLVLISVAGSFCLRLLLSRRLAKVLITPLSQYNLSNSPIDIQVTLSSLYLWPFWALEIEFLFHTMGVKAPRHLITGPISLASQCTFNSCLTFPHRGYWALKSLKLSIADRLGLSRVPLHFPLENLIEISAKDLAVSPIPIEALDPHSGDLHNLQHIRQGDLYDIKQYDPSDGLKKILWKVFAKSGQLVVRRPEPAIIPQGEIALYLVARPEDDFVAGAIQTYVNLLNSRDITILFGTDGLSHVVSEPQIKTTINQMAMHQDSGTGRGLTDYANSLGQQSQSLEVIIFTAASNTSWISEISPGLANTPFKFTVVLVTETNQPAKSGSPNIFKTGFSYEVVECEVRER